MGARRCDPRVHLWLVPLDVEPDPGLERVLDRSERSRRRAFRREEDARAFLLSHVALRCVLGRHLGCDPAALRFKIAAGKPRLDPARHPAGPEFSLSHTGGLAAIAVGWDRPVGVDVEAIPERFPVWDVASRCFHERERAVLEAEAPAGLVPAFHRVWCRKEACLKATGVGLTDRMCAFSTVDAPDPDGPVLVDMAAVGSPPVYVQDVGLGTSHAASLACSRPPSGVERLLYAW
jgi:4'-phosphopantetheinyl transferase